MNAPHTPHSPHTYELSLRFTASQAAADKQAVLAWLAARQVPNVVEGVIDGIENEIVDDVAAASVAETRVEDGALFGESDDTPILIFAEESVFLDTLMAQLAQTFGDRIAMRMTALAHESWSEAWVENPVTVTRRFVVAPSAQHAEGGRHLIVIRDDSAFGDGRHATTQVALEMLEDLAEQNDARGAFLDVGTGTGVLAIAAHHLGYRPIVATDLDASILGAARTNIDANIKTHAVTPVVLIQSDSLPEDGSRYEVIAANILAPVLHQLLPSFVASLAPHGILLLSGFIDKEAEPLLEAAARHGLVVHARRACRGWVALGLKLTS